MPGPKPKPLGMRVRPSHAATRTTIEASMAARVSLSGRHEPETLAWWDVIWSSPISAEWVDADVPGLVALAALVDLYWRAANGDGRDASKFLAEIRMQCREFGLTPMARRSLQWEVKRVERASELPSATPAPTRKRDPRLRALA